MLLAALAGRVYYYSSSGENLTEGVATFLVEKRDLVDTVIERGTLESQSKVEGKCELHGWQNKITFIVDEGAAVKEGDVVVKFDASEIAKGIAEQKVAVSNAQAAVDDAEQQLEVQKNKNESDIAAAKLEKDLAELDLVKYKDGDYKAELADIDRSIAESKAAVEQSSEELKNIRVLIKKGYREPVRLRQIEQAAKSAKFQLDRDNQKKEVLTKFTYKRQITELESKAEEAARKLDRASATAAAEMSKAKLTLSGARDRLKIETEELKEEEEQLGKATIKAKQSGTVAYANNRWMDPDFRIRPGGNVHRRQTVFHLPDMSRMQVQIDIHESLINKLKVGQRAIVRVSSFPDHQFTGELHKVADLASSDRNTDAKTYSAVVLIDDFPDKVKLKPGMNAEVEIHIRTLKGVAAVPVQAITQIAGGEYAYVKRGNSFKRSPVKVSEGNESFLQLDSGIELGDVVALDAYQRGLVDIEEEGLDRPTTDESAFEAAETEDEDSDEAKDSKDGSAEADEAATGLASEEAGSKQEAEKKEPATESEATDEPQPGAETKDAAEMESEETRPEPETEYTESPSDNQSETPVEAETAVESDGESDAEPKLPAQPELESPSPSDGTDSDSEPSLS